MHFTVCVRACHLKFGFNNNYSTLIQIDQPSTGSQILRIKNSSANTSLTKTPDAIAALTLSVDLVSSSEHGATVNMIAALEFPPSEFFSSLVSLQERKATCLKR